MPTTMLQNSPLSTPDSALYSCWLMHSLHCSSQCHDKITCPAIQHLLLANLRNRLPSKSISTLNLTQSATQPRNALRDNPAKVLNVMGERAPQIYDNSTQLRFVPGFRFAISQERMNVWRHIRILEWFANVQQFGIWNGRGMGLEYFYSSHLSSWLRLISPGLRSTISKYCPTIRRV